MFLKSIFLSAKDAKKREENPTPVFPDFYFASLRG